MADVLGNPVGAIDLRDPLRHLTEHPAIIHFLEGFALDHVAADLANEQNHRCRILITGMHADARIGRARAARDETDAWTPRKLAVGFSHESRAAFLTAHDQPHAFANVVKRVQNIEIALARNTKCRVRAMNYKLVHQNASAASEWHVFVHSCSPCRQALDYTHAG